ncbi:MAG: cupredoxin domain-containing protein, partial [Candidatus Omnitrophica bacterium]|nr:cupredoxin domain-containing protein [Candidatus Omnitrophota bacterium]
IGAFLSCLLIGAYLCTKASANKNDFGRHEAPAVEGKLSLSGKLESGVRVVPIKASRYKFEPDSIVVRVGEKVRLVFTSVDAEHGLEIADFKVNFSAPEGKTEVIELIADKKGTFHAHCSVYCGPGHRQMHAMFIVTDSDPVNSH